MKNCSITTSPPTFVDESTEPSAAADPKPSGKGRGPLLLLIIVLLICGLFSLQNDEAPLPPGLEKDKDGKIVLAPDRRMKLERELSEIDNAIQYALVALIDGVYPCFSCPDGRKTIFLQKGNVWKYGVTRTGEARRYPGSNYGAEDLLFLPQFQGTYSECLKREKRMIYHYPLLPEAIAREFLLIRPPGNAYDG